MWSSRRSLAAHALMFALALGGVVCLQPSRAQAPPKGPDPRTFLNTYCITCHNQKLRTAGLALDGLDAAKPSANAEIWERVIAKLQAGSMPPPGLPRPDAAVYRAVASSLENEIDNAIKAEAAAPKKPDEGDRTYSAEDVRVRPGPDPDPRRPRAQRVTVIRQRHLPRSAARARPSRAAPGRPQDTRR